LCESQSLRISIVAIRKIAKIATLRFAWSVKSQHCDFRHIYIFDLLYTPYTFYLLPRSSHLLLLGYLNNVNSFQAFITNTIPLTGI